MPGGAGRRHDRDHEPGAVERAPLVYHAKAKVIFKFNRATFRHSRDPEAAPPKAFSGGDLYAAARRSGLEFGPPTNKSWPPRVSATMSSSWIGSPQEAIPVYRYNLTRLDACFHGLILLFADNSSSPRPAAYLPVRFGEIRLEKPGAAVSRRGSTSAATTRAPSSPISR